MGLDRLMDKKELLDLLQNNVSEYYIAVDIIKIKEEIEDFELEEIRTNINKDFFKRYNYDFSTPWYPNIIRPKTNHYITHCDLIENNKSKKISGFIREHVINYSPDILQKYRDYQEKYSKIYNSKIF